MKFPGAGRRTGIKRLFSKAGGGEGEFPFLPLRELVLFPNTVIPLFITLQPGIAAVEEALRHDLRLFAACVPGEKKGPAEREKREDPARLVGVVARIVQYLRLPDNTFRIVLQNEYRGSVVSVTRGNGFSTVRVEPVKITDFSNPPGAQTAALMRVLRNSFVRYAEYSKKIGAETITAAEKSENPERLANIVCNAVAVKPEKKLALLGIAGTRERLEAVIETLETENEIFGIQKSISGKVKSRMEKSQREYILHEQIREINKELGNETAEDEFAEIEKAIAHKNPGAEVLDKARKEIGRIRKLPPFSPEAGVLRGYLEWIADLPWSEYSADAGAGAADLAEAERILDEDHFGMRKAKDRILEFIAVRQLIAPSGRPPDALPPDTPLSDMPQADMSRTDAPRPDALPAGMPPEASGMGLEDTPLEKTGIKGPILCFVGPPGTGKTSLGRSVARALRRRFVRVSLGGVRDEAEIRGHRKTYVGSLPGKIIQSMQKAGTMNPVFLLDEIDKLSSDFRGDPASALLEVLDPEQNSTFTDHYLEVPYDLSKVLFITTANSLHAIPYPLLDRMEIIEIPGYGENEKLAIARQFLVPKELNENGLKDARVLFTDETIREIIRHWTMESGVRGLEREIARCARRVARAAVKKNYGRDKPISSFKKTVRTDDLEKLLGRRKYKDDVVFREARIGVTYGLAWTETGGTVLPVETIHFEGNGDFIITGNLGDVMKESARIALSYLRSGRDRYNFTVRDPGKTDFHVHVPEGAIPKDGPSAGITLAASLLSTLCRVPPRPGIAMTGELTLTGRVLPVGGLKEKLLAAIRNGMEKVLLPADNRDEWEELDRDIRGALSVDFVENADEVFGILFDRGIRKRRAGKS
ncbi:MAG: endopeptidase La [Treponema sp.]|jgi:ATP-dependent Lon protease|nr:endopeptidase La [Treponema sp.]